MKLCFLLLLLIVTVEYIQSKKALMRTFIIERDTVIKGKPLTAYTVYSASGIICVYQLETVSTDIDALILITHPGLDMVANLEGEWVNKIFNVTFTIYDKKLNRWVDGTIKIDSTGLREKYLIEWNSKHFNTKTSFFSGTVRIYDTEKKEVVAEIRRRKPWFGSGKVNFELKTYSIQFPDAIYFFILAINDHRVQRSSSKG
jgi:hypothetical protein